MSAIKMDVTENGSIRLKDVFSGILLETTEGNQIGIAMRDDSFEINVMPQGNHIENWWRIDMQTGTIVRMCDEQG